MVVTFVSEDHDDFGPEMAAAHHESATGGDGGGSDGGTVRVDDGMLARVGVTCMRDWV